MVLSPYPGHSKPLTGRPRNRGEIKYYYRVKQSYFEELVCNGAQGRTDSPGANQDARAKRERLQGENQGWFSSIHHPQAGNPYKKQ